MNEIDTITWECPNGHWTRVEFLLADGAIEDALCPICKSLMTLGRRSLQPVRHETYNKYSTMIFGVNKKKKKGANKNDYTK